MTPVPRIAPVVTVGSSTDMAPTNVCRPPRPRGRARSTRPVGQAVAARLAARFPRPGTRCSRCCRRLPHGQGAAFGEGAQWCEACAVALDYGRGTGARR